MGISVRQRQSGKDAPWWIFIHYEGKRKAKCIGDRETAEKLASLLREKVAKEGLGLPASKEMPGFKEYAEKWLHDYVGTCCKATTYSGYDVSLRVHLYPLFEKKRLDGITRADVKTLIFSMLKKDLATSTVHQAVACLSGILSAAVEDGVLAVNPALRTGKFLKNGRPKEEIDFLTREEAARFLTTVREHFPVYYPLFLCALRTGMRIGEVLGLEWGDIDFSGRFLKVQRALVRGRVTTTKNGKTRRVDVSGQLADVLQGLRLEQKKRALRSGYAAIPERVFLTAAGTAIDLPHLRQRVFHKCLEKAGLRRVRIHDLRHSYASLLLQQGESLVYVRDQLGHGSIRITADTYSHLIPGANREAVDKLDDSGATSRNLYATTGLSGAMIDG